MKLTINSTVIAAVSAGIWGMMCVDVAWGQVFGNSATTGLSNFSGSGMPRGSSTLANFTNYSTGISSRERDLTRNILSANMQDLTVPQSGNRGPKMQMRIMPVSQPLQKRLTGLEGFGAGQGNYLGMGSQRSFGHGYAVSGIGRYGMMPMRGMGSDFQVRARDLLQEQNMRGGVYLSSIYGAQGSRKGLIRDTAQLSERKTIGRSNNSTKEMPGFRRGSGFLQGEGLHAGSRVSLSEGRRLSEGSGFSSGMKDFIP